MLNDPSTLWVLVTFAATAIFLTLAVSHTLRRPAASQRFEEALRIIHSSELEADDLSGDDDASRVKTRRGWFGYWEDRVAKTGKIPADPKTPGRLAIGLAVGMLLVGGLVFPRGVVGFLAGPVFGLGLWWAWLGAEQRKRVSVMEKQLPMLLTALRANLQAAAQAPQALMAVADDLPSPLGDEIRMVKHDLLVHVPLTDALHRLTERVASREVAFLVASIEIAVRSGQDLDPQIGVIQGIIEQRTRIRAKLRAAVASVSPTKWLAYASVPFMFLMNIRNPVNKAYWFGPGLVWLFVLSALYVVGIVVIRMMVRSVENS